jgi:hypothetical protein
MTTSINWVQYKLGLLIIHSWHLSQGLNGGQFFCISGPMRQPWTLFKALPCPPAFTLYKYELGLHDQ